MRTTPLVPLFLACLVVPAPLPAQSSSPASNPGQQTPASIFQQALAALTGAPVTDATLTGTAERIAGSDDETGAATLKATALGDSRVDLSLTSGTYTEIRNHAGTPLPGSLPPGVSAPTTQTPQPVGASSGPDGTLQPMTLNNMLTDPTWFFPALTLGRLVSSPTYVLSYVGQETRDGQPVVHLSAWLGVSSNASSQPQLAALIQQLSQMDIFLNPSTLLPVDLAFSTHPANDLFVDIAIEIRFSDYQAVSGTQVPFHVQKYINNGLALDLQVSSVTLNDGLTAAPFQLQ